LEGVKALLSILFALFMMGLVLFLAYYTTNWLGKKVALGGQSSSQNMKVLDRMLLMQDKSLLIVQVGNERFLLAVTKESVQLLHKLDENEVLTVKEDYEQNFVDVFKDMLKNREGRP